MPDPPRARRPPAGRAGTVVGRVVDALGNAVADVTVVATPGWIGATPPAHPLPTTLSDRTGRFQFVGLPPGDYIFVTLHGIHASSVSPVMPVDRHGALEVVLIVGGPTIPA
ncbi:MAG: carboxypeptidase regulatory-like domain-containing protein [Kofleriaceae bacterium]|nr:carboxypeptidase regulatory-like domain-containing protein [Kofleriaceae bacterium]